MAPPPALILDHVYAHEAELANLVFRSQPVGGGEVIDITWAQAMDQSRRMAAHLHGLGFAPCARIAMLSRNCAHFILAELALLIYTSGCTGTAKARHGSGSPGGRSGHHKRRMGMDTMHSRSGGTHLAAPHTRRANVLLMPLCAALLWALAMPSAFGQSSAAAALAPAADVKSAQSISSTGLADLPARSTLTGDWGSARSTLAGKGVSFDLRHTSTYQGLVEGTGPKDFEYGGKVDAFINFDSAKLGLWEGGGFRSHIEYRHGAASSGLGGAIFAVNAMLYWPGDTPNRWAATSLYLTQKLGDAGSIAIGKFNPDDLLAADPFYGGWGIDRFMNLILAAPPSGLIPVVFMGAVASIKAEPINWTVMVYDPQDRTFDYLPGNLFQTGVNVSVSGAHVTTLAGRKTTYAATAIYSTAEGTDYSGLQPGISSTATKKGSYNVSVEFRHNLQESPLQPDAGWGFSFKLAVADGNPNYVQSSAIAGIAGKAIFLGRPQDSFGFGAYRYNLSDLLQTALRPNTSFSNEAAGEAYYNYKVTPWLHVTGDLQYIKPATSGFKNALVAALRTQIRF